MTNPFPRHMTSANPVLASSRGACRKHSRSRYLPALAICARGAIARRIGAGFVVAALVLPLISSAQETQTNSPSQLLVQALTRLAGIIEPPANQAPRTFTTTLKVVKADGLPKEVQGRELELAFQAPNHLRI